MVKVGRVLKKKKGGGISIRKIFNFLLSLIVPVTEAEYDEVNITRAALKEDSPCWVSFFRWLLTLGFSLKQYNSILSWLESYPIEVKKLILS